MDISLPNSDALARLRPILETALDAVVIIDGEGIVVAWNAVAERIFGWTAEEAVHRSMADLIVPPQHRDAHTNGLSRFQASGEARVLNQRLEITALRKDGSEFPVELSITKAALSGATLFVGFLRDISARLNSQRVLARQARESELLFRLTRLAAETESIDEVLRASLEAICELTGWPVGHALVVTEDKGELVSTDI